MLSFEMPAIDGEKRMSGGTGPSLRAAGKVKMRAFKPAELVGTGLPQTPEKRENW
jgi:hypothetical protein